MRKDVDRRAALQVFGIRGLALALAGAGPLGAQRPPSNAVQARANAERKRLDMERFGVRESTKDFDLGASFTGHSMIGADRSVFVRDHLLLEVILVPANSKMKRIDGSSFGLKVNDESLPRFPQAPVLQPMSSGTPKCGRAPDWKRAAKSGAAGWCGIPEAGKRARDFPATLAFRLGAQPKTGKRNGRKTPPNWMPMLC
ncbi:MAG: hypothetical protein U5J83_13710 [Bryobacterales bacterium]|nr:hypothetical protein [Bryobacterales bacterium]